MRPQCFRMPLFVTLALLISAVAEAKYIPPRLHELAGGSALILHGKIVELSDTTFAIEVDEVLAGTVPPGKVVIRTLDDWTCAHRWKRYAVGQEEIAFVFKLSSDEAAKAGCEYGLMSAGTEGEWEIRGKEVSVQQYPVPGSRKSLERSIGDNWLPVADVLEALRGFRKYFSVQGGGWNMQVRQICSNQELDEFRRHSNFHESLVKSALDSIEVQKKP